MDFSVCLWGTPGFTVSSCIPDFMHCVDLGILQCVCGNATWEIILFLGGNFTRWQGACGLLLNMVRLAARQLNIETPFNNLTIGMIIPKATGKPRMKLKAAEGRHCIVVLRKM